MEIYSGHEGKDRVCCNCEHNKIMLKSVYVRCICDIDGHYIGYIEGYDCWCRRWAKERRADCEDETDEEWYDWRDEQEYEDRWERRADE